VGVGSVCSREDSSRTLSGRDAEETEEEPSWKTKGVTADGGTGSRRNRKGRGVDAHFQGKARSREKGRNGPSLEPGGRREWSGGKVGGKIKKTTDLVV